MVNGFNVFSFTGQKEKHITRFSSAFSALSIVLIGFLFVDDTDLIVIGDGEEGVEEIRVRQQQSLTSWENVL